MLLPTYGAVDANVAAALVRQYHRLPGELRTRILVSAERLILAMVRTDSGAQALDVSIALEALLLSDEKGDNKFKTSLRAALVAGADIGARRRIREVIRVTYDVRSALVHNGHSSGMVKIGGQGKVSAISVTKDAVGICAAVLRRVLELGKEPEWTDIELGATMC
jgi:hypothetical protein